LTAKPRLGQFSSTLLLAAALFVVPACAQEAGEKPDQASETAAANSGQTESADTKPGMELWKWVNFAILAGALGWLSAKHLGPLLSARSHEIHEGLAAGEKARAEADARAAAVQAKIANLGDAISQMKTSAREERDREAERIRRDCLAELARVEHQANQEIDSAGKVARLEVHRFAASLAIELAEQKVRARMSAETQSALINNFIAELGDTTHAG
jgi:F-type H+-transporting ATPase subunit b